MPQAGCCAGFNAGFAQSLMPPCDTRRRENRRAALPAACLQNLP